MDSLPQHPDQQLQYGQEMVTRAYRIKTNQLNDELIEQQQANQEKSTTIQSLKLQIQSLRNELNNKDQKIEILMDDHENLKEEKSDLFDQVKRLNQEIGKLSSFKKSIVQSVDQDAHTSLESFPTIVGDDVLNQSSSHLLQSMSPSKRKTFDGHSSAPKFYESKPTSYGESHNHNLMTSSGSLLGRRPQNSSFNHQDLGFSSGSKKYADIPPATRPEDSYRSSPSGSFRFNSNSTDIPSLSSLSHPYIEGKDFFRQAKAKLTFQQFNEFLSCIKNLNNQTASKTETLDRAKRIFGLEHSDLYYKFSNLVLKHVEE